MTPQTDPRLLTPEQLEEITTRNKAREFIGVPTIVEVVEAGNDISDLLAHHEAYRDQVRQVLAGLLACPAAEWERDEATYQRACQEYEDAIHAAAAVLGVGHI